MKNFTKLLLVIVSLITPFIGFSQIDHTDHHHEHKGAQGQSIDKFYLPLDFDKDSLVGFDESAAWEAARRDFAEAWEQERMVAVLKRNFIDFHYGFKVNAPLPSVQAPCTNPDFETGTLAGWTALEGPNNNSQTMAGCCPNPTGQAVIVGPGADPNVPAVSMVPVGGGNFAVRLGQTGTGGKSYRLNQTFTVTAANSVFVYKYAIILQDGTHSCSEQPFFNIKFETCNNVVIPCAQYQASAAGSGCSATSGADPSFLTSGGWLYKDWQTRSFDLSPYIGQCVNIEFTVGGCVASQGAHPGYCYIDASCQPMTLNLNGTDIPVGQTTTNMCTIGSNTLCAPPGFTSYTWNGPGGANSQTSQCISTSVAGTYSVTLGMQGTSCQSPVLYSTFNLVPKPIANFTFTTTPCQNTFTVPFSNTSSLNGGPAISNYYWDFDGNGVVDNSTANPTNTFPAPGTYTTELKVSNGGCTDSITKVITVTPAPTANFNVSSACLNTVTNFTSTATPTVGLASHVWDFGDGTANGSGPNPTHTYTSPGTKNVTYTVTNTDGCSSVFTKTLGISPNPVVAISSNTVCLNLTTAFTNSSSVSAPDNITTWAWDFDNNGTIDNTSQFPTNTYTSVGTHTAELTVTTNNGCKDSLTIPVVVNDIQTGSFAAGNACLNSVITLTNNTTVVAPNSISLYSWNFGVDAIPATATGFNPTLPAYSTSGTKIITLNLTANTSCTASVTQTIQIYAQPVANFSATSVCQSTATAFTDLSAPTGSIVAWAWDFTNNGSIDNTTSAPTNVYPASGTFSASLIVTDSRTCKDTVVLPLNVWGHSIPNFTSTTVCFGSVSTFSNLTNTTTNTNVGGAPTWIWNFGDGLGASTVQNPTYLYTTGAGSVFNVTLTATTTNGCVDNVVKTVTVNALPTATFTPINACMNSNVLLNNTSNITLPDNITNYAWSFGAGSAPTSTSNIQNPPILSYNSSGVKAITLIVTSNTTCTATITQTVTIYAQPIANFSATSVCQSTATVYTDLSTTPVGAITGWQWDFTSNSSIDNTTNAPTNVFVTSGTFTTSLIVTSTNGCKDTASLPVNVWGHTIPNFTPDKVCFGTSSLFINLTDETTNPNVGAGTTYFWDFNDGNTSGLIGPSHTYTQGGNVNASYNVTLTATSMHNCIDNIIKVVNVYAVPTASFTSDSVCLGSPSTMTDASAGNGNAVNNYVWDFLNDATVDVTGVANPNFIFPNFGNNAVSYTVSTSPVAGLVCANTTNTIMVWVNPNPVPDFTFVNKCINAQPNIFNGSPSTIAIGTNMSYGWDYGDGTFSSPVAASASSHVYSTAGVYSATLTVTSNKGCKAAITKQVAVYEKPYMKIANSSACDQSAMTFTAVTLPNSGTIVNWFWDFNNSISTFEGAGQTTNFIFAAPGAQSVALIGETNNGCKDTIKKPIYVNYNPVAIFSGDKLSGCPIPKHCVNFTDASPSITGPAQISQWQWSLGDGTTLTNPTSASVNHCYGNSSSNQLALFSVSLVVRTDSGCVSPVNNKVNYITVYPTPIAAYTVNPNPGNVLTPLEYFTNQSIDYTKWWWSFGDGPFKTDSVNIDPTHFYSDVSAGTYYSNLIVMNQYGCSDTAYVPVEIGPEFTFYIPNAFSPANDDNINDYFTGKGIGIAHFEMWIFDRWGEKIFYTDDINKGWDGRVQGKSGEGKQDVYIWKVKLKDVLDKKHEYIGHVTLLR
ncbi:MAG: PKD domain-containing protein [Burkholderiales bacterium]|nr:PKD domain-containing protein [Bacteroidia bacterium]